MVGEKEGTPHIIFLQNINDCYFFSPFFFSQGKDRRWFFITLLYKNIKFITSNNGIHSDTTKALSTWMVNINKEIEKRLIPEAEEIVNSFRIKDVVKKAP